MKNLESKIKAVKTEVSVTNQFEISIQTGSAMNHRDKSYFYEEFKGNKAQAISKLKQYTKRIQAEMFEDENGFLAYLQCRSKDRNWNTSDVFRFKIQSN